MLNRMFIGIKNVPILILTVTEIIVIKVNTVYVKTFEGENFRGSSTICIM